MNANKILHVACKAGKIILENGGEIYRVEETICRICSAFGFKEADSFVTPTVIMVSIVDKDDNTISIAKRISARTVNLEKISLVNDLSRNIVLNKLSPEYVSKELEKIDSTHSYSNITMIIYAALGAGFFTLLFNGTLKDFIISVVIGSILKFLSIKLSDLKVNVFFINILGGAVAALIALISTHIGIGDNLDKIIIGSIMLLVPGLAITNAIRDSIEGDLLSGGAKALEALLTAIAIAAGSGIIIKLWMMWLGGIKL